MLDFTIVTAPFRYGIDEGTDPKQVPPGTLMTCENLSWVKTGRLQKRNGISAFTKNIVGGGTLPSADRLFTRGGELCLITGQEATGTTAYSYSTAGWKKTANKATLADAGLEWAPLQAGNDGARRSDIAGLQNQAFVQVWESGDPAGDTAGTLFYQIIDPNNGAVSTKPTSLGAIVAIGAATYPASLRVLSDGANWIVFFLGTAGLRVSYNGGASTLLIATAALLTGAFDVCMFGTTEFLIASAKVGGGINLQRFSFVAVPVSAATGVVTGEAGNLASISIDEGGFGVLWIAYATGTYFVTDELILLATANPSTLVQVLIPTSVDNTGDLVAATIGIVAVSATSVCVTYSASARIASGAVFNNGMLASLLMSNAGAKTTAICTSSNMHMITRPIMVAGHPYAFVSRYTDSFSVFTANPVIGFLTAGTYMVDLTSVPTDKSTPRYIGRLNVLEGSRWSERHVSTSLSLGSTEFKSIIPSFAAAPTTIYGWLNAVQLVRTTFGTLKPVDMWRSVSIGMETYLAAGVLQAYDGRMIFDSGMAEEPGIPLAVAGAGASGSMATGAYVYQATCEYKDAAEVLHRGPVSLQISATSAVLGSVTLTLVPVHLSQKFDRDNPVTTDTLPVLIVLNRSTVGGSVPQRLTVEPTYNIAKQAAYTYQQTFVDTRSDTDITTSGQNTKLAERPAIYTQGGELEDFQAPALSTIALYRNRIFGIDGGGNTIWFTKDFTSNPGIAPGFNPAFRLIVNDTLTSLAVLDERLVIFSETGIYIVSGDGPALNGDGDFGPVTKLQTDVGSTNARCSASVSPGVFFESNGQIYLLDRKLTVVWIGKPVQDLLVTYPVITSAVVVDKLNEVRFTCAALNHSTGVVLVYNYEEGQWSVFRYGASIAIADAIMHQGAYKFVTYAGQLYSETPGAYLDDGAYVVSKIETAWMHSTGPLNYQSVRNFLIDGISGSAHGLSISVGFDGNTTYQQGPRTWAEGIANVTATGPIAAAKLSIGTRRKCRSIRFKIEDTAPAVLGTGQGPLWSTMGIEVGQKRGPGKLPIAVQR